MTDQSFIIVPAERLDRMERTLADLVKALDGATVTPAPKWLTLGQAAEAMRCHKSTVHRLAEKGEIETKRANGKRLFKVETD